MCHLISFTFFLIKMSILRRITTWTRLCFTLTLLAFSNNTTLCCRIKFWFGTLLFFINQLRVILANRRISLFEIDINSDGLDIVERILFVEGQRKVTFVVNAGTTNVFLSVLFKLLYVVGCWTNVCHSWVWRVHIINHFESFFFVHKLLINRLPFILQPINCFNHMIFHSLMFLISIRAGSRILIKILHQLHLAVKS